MEKMFDREISIEDKKVNPVKLFKDYFNQYRVENKLNKKALSFDNSISLEEKDKALNKVMLSAVESALNVKKPEMLSFANWANQTAVKEMTFAMISALIDAVLPETLIDDIGLYTDVRTGGFGDSFKFDIKPRELFTVSESGHGKRTGRIQKQFRGSMTLLPVNHEVTVETSVYKVLAGEESLGEFTAKAIKAIETQITYDCYDAMHAALTASAMPTELKLTGFTQDSAIRLATQVTAWNGNKKAMFVGTNIALSKILPANANYRYDLDSDYVKTAHVRDYFGYSLLELPQVADYEDAEHFGLKLDDNTIYVISPTADKLVKLGLEGSVLSYVSKLDGNANLTQDATFNKSWDAQVITSAIAGSITIA